MLLLGLYVIKSGGKREEQYEQSRRLNHLYWNKGSSLS